MSTWKKPGASLRVVLATVCCTLLASLTGSAVANAALPSAEALLGQYDVSGNPDFTASGTNNGGAVGNIGFSGPSGTAVDPTGHRLFQSDLVNNRVLVFSLDALNRPLHKNADNVLGQTNFTNHGSATTQTGLNGPSGLAYSPSTSMLYVSDANNNRVMVFDTSSISDGMAAVHVLGQTLFTTTTSGHTQTSFDVPTGLALDDSGHHLFVGEYNNHRVTVFDTTSVTDHEPASYVLGQADFTSTVNAVTQNNMEGPSSVAYDSGTHRLAVTDNAAIRVMIFDATTLQNGQNATSVLGQTTFTASSNGTTASTFTSPNGVAFDSNTGRLFVSDSTNFRILGFDPTTGVNGQAAAFVFGQANFTSAAFAVDSSHMSPTRSAFDAASGRLIVSDGAGSRVLFFNVNAYWAGANTTVNTNVDSTITFAVSGRSSACNGVALTSTTATPTAVPLGRVNSTANGIAAQDLTVTTNAAGGFTVFLRDSGAMSDGNGHSIADISGDNTTPGAFPAAGTAGFGYTTSDSTLNATANRFTNPSANWAKLTTTNQPVSFGASGPVTADVACVAYQMSVASTTPAGTYSTTVVYSAVPIF